MTRQTTQQADTTTGELPPDAADKQELGQAALVLWPNEAHFKLALEPKNMEELFTLAGVLAKTRICGVSTPEEVIVRALTGRDLGLTLMQSLRGIYDVEGKPAIDASLMHALCLQSHECVQFRCVKTTDEIATYAVQRRGEAPEEISFTIEEAIAAGLVDRGDTADAKKKNNWNRWRRAMLRARAKSNAARMKFPGVIMGMYSGEELRDRADREDELIGEIVPPTVHVAARDFDGEVGAFEAQIRAVTSSATGKPVRAAIEAWDGPAATKAQLVERYSARAEELRKARAAGTSAAPASPPAVPTAPPSEPKAERQPGED